MYYKLLNCGFRLAATGGTDNFPDVWRDPPPGTERTYARVQGPLTVASWIGGSRRDARSARPVRCCSSRSKGRGRRRDCAAGARPRELRCRSRPCRLRRSKAGDDRQRPRRRRRRRRRPVRDHFERHVAIPEGGWIAARVVGPARDTSPTVTRSRRPVRSMSSATAGYTSAKTPNSARVVDAIWARADRALAVGG